MKSMRPSWWKQWLKPSRVVPLLTILGAGITNALSLFGLLRLSTSESIIIALLGLLAIDALVERKSILEKVESLLNGPSSKQALKTRAEILTPPNHAQAATEICILGLHGATGITPYVGFYEQKLREGCKIRIILVDPSSSVIDLWEQTRGNRTTRAYLQASLEALKLLRNISGREKKCEVRLLHIYPPFSMFAIDLYKDTGSIIVEFLGYKASIDRRPHIRLTALSDPYWFNFFRQQFEDYWMDAQVWKLDDSGQSKAQLTEHL